MIRRALRTDLAAFLIVAFFMSPLIYWGFDRTEPVAVHQFRLQPGAVYPGDRLLRLIEVTRRRACVTSVDVVIIDGARVRWIIDEPDITRPGYVGGRDSYSVPMLVPPLAYHGKAEVRVTTRWECNPLHRIWPIIKTFDPLYFTIMER